MIKTNITSRHFKSHETLNEMIQNGIDNLSKYNEDILYADVILSFEKQLTASRFVK